MSSAVDIRPAGLNFGVHVRAQRAGLELSDELPFDEWVALGRKLGSLTDSSSWWLGDWINQGEIIYGGKYELALEVTGLSYQTLMNIAAVAKAFHEISRRREILSFTHHAVVAGLDRAEQDDWLDRAEANDWSAMKLRHELGFRRDVPSADSLQRLQLAVHSARAERWRSAAERVGKPFGDWAAEVLDQAAA